MLSSPDRRPTPPSKDGIEVFGTLSALTLVLGFAYPTFPLAIPAMAVFMFVASLTLYIGESNV